MTFGKFDINPRLGWPATIAEIAFLLAIVVLAYMKVLETTTIAQLMLGYGAVRGGGLVSRTVTQQRNERMHTKVPPCAACEREKNYKA
jgi:hypothetical protein